MKTIFAFAMVLASGSAFAADSWFCTASGYDWNNQEQSVSSDYFPTEEAAQEDALRICYGLYRSCRVDSCFNLGWPERPISEVARR